MKNEHGFEVVALTRGPKHHFFGYYDIQTWDSTGSYVLALESDFDDRFPTAADTAVVGMVEWETRRFHRLTRTRAWNLQQGCDVRCDLHPRWNRHDRWIAFDSVHEGSRQVYALDAGPAGDG